MKLVLVRPPWNPWLENRMFTGAEGCVYVRAFCRWRELAGAHGFQIDSWDLRPLSEADCVWMMDLPPQRKLYEHARKETRTGTPFVLQVLESPLLGPQNFVAANRRHFEAVVTFERELNQAQNCFGYRLPNTLRLPTQDLPFVERRCAVMLNTNRVEGFLAVRQPGLAGLPGVGGLFSGWKLPASTLLRPARGELYSWRRSLARSADEIGYEVLDVFGPGWQGEQISWFPGYFNRPYQCATHRPHPHTKGSENRAAKQDLFGRYRFGIASENYRGSLGYVSEKLFDVIMAGAVPVYLGEERISDFVPAACFVDVRDFRNHRELLHSLRNCSEHEWQAKRDAGQAFLCSEKMRPFTDEAFAERMIDILKKLLFD